MRAPVKPARVGRFSLVRQLGRGAQATVWLAHDARLDREVALKLLDVGHDGVALEEWLHEARAVSRLAHPHIVPVFEADEDEGRPYLVFEYVPGPTLAAHLRERAAPMPAREAAVLMRCVLDALAAAHERGIVHRDLKPSNILLDANGQPRVMDFGIAAHMDDAGRVAADQRGMVCGTPGYIAPEAARGAAPQPSMDVFAAGVLLAELLSGERLLSERDPLRALARVQVEDLKVPAVNARGEPIDEALRELAQRALARHPGERTAAVAGMRDALDRWLAGDTAVPAAAAPEAGAGDIHGTLDFLMRRMKHRGDFPALSDAVARIQRVANSEHHNLSTLSDEILKDVALTNKLLRVVNSAHFKTAGGPVSTVSRAVALVGFAGIRNMALSLVLLERMQDKRHADQIKEEYLRALMAATLADALTPVAREAEETFLAAMFQSLGRLLVEFYFPEEARQVRAFVQPATARGAALDEASAARRVLGLTYQDIGAGVAKAWGLPDSLQRAMRSPEGEPPARPIPAAGLDRQRWLGRMATEMADAMLEAADGKQSRFDVIVERYGRALGVDRENLEQAAASSQQRLSTLTQAMQLQLGAKARARRLLAGEATASLPDDSLSEHTLRATDLSSLDEPAPARDTAKVAEVLAQGVQDITTHMVGESFKLNEVLRMILETMFRALEFRRVVFCLRDPKTNTLTGRFGLGDGAAEVAAAMRVPLVPAPGAAPDLFTAVCLKGADTLIADATQPGIAGRLPGWFRAQVAAPSFLLLPLVLKGAPFALIYADQGHPGGIELGEKELALLRTLRNQGVMAFRQAA
ncbi:MAG TPA: HDOD domain-containing protein [Burkholderiaceae bacterium]|nr:HDOD domain-containing protein [Burkholderiaceae bacterium]